MPSGFVAGPCGWESCHLAPDGTWLLNALTAPGNESSLWKSPWRWGSSFNL